MSAIVTCQKCGYRFNEFEGAWWSTIPPSPAQCPRCFPGEKTSWVTVTTTPELDLTPQGQRLFTLEQKILELGEKIVALTSEIRRAKS